MNETISAPGTLAPLVRLVLGAVLAGAVAGAAWRARSLSGSGVAAAILCGAAAAAAGWGWAILLVVYFVASTALSRLGHRAKLERTGDLVEKGGARDAAQVLANGGLFAALALAALIRPGALPAFGALGALAASAADTWATEIGTLWGRAPRSIITGRRVPPGESGGITAVGTLGAVAGAAFIGVAGRLCGWSIGAALASIVAGVAGAMADSLLGAAAQERRYCDRCAAWTERREHHCGTATRVAAGVPGIDNDVVNLLATLTGGIVAVGIGVGVGLITGGGRLG